MEKTINSAINALLVAMGPHNYIIDDPFQLAQYKGTMKSYFKYVVCPVIKRMFNLMNYDLADELHNLYPNMFHYFDKIKINIQSCRINRICMKLQRQMAKLENDYVQEVGSATSFYKLRDTCITNLKFNDVINQQLLGKPIAGIKHSVELSKHAQVVYNRYLTLRQLYMLLPGEPPIRCYEDYNGCVKNMKPAILSQFIRPGYINVSSPDLKLMKTPISESMVESIVNDFNDALMLFNKC